MDNRLSDEYQRYLKEVSGRRLSLFFVPEQFRTFGICLAAVKREADAFLYAPQALQQSTGFCLAAVSQNEHALRHIPKELRTPDFYREAVRENGFALFYVPVPEKSRDLCLAAVKQAAEVLKLVPRNLLTPDFYREAMSENGLALEYIPENSRTAAIYEAAVSQNGFALQYVPKRFQALNICLASIQQNPLALRYILDEETKKNCINQLTVEKILSDNYSARQYFPENTYQNEIRQFLATKKHIVIIENQEATEKSEIKDSYTVYANKMNTDANKTRRGKTILILKNDLPSTLKDLKDNQDLNLILLGHKDPDNKSIAGLVPSDVTPVLKDHPNINRITLLSCRSAQASVLAEEEQLIAEVKEYQNLHSPKGKCGFVFMLGEPDEREQKKILAKLDSCYVLIKQGEQTSCMLIQKSEGGEVSHTLASMTDEQVLFCQKKFNKDRNFKPMKNVPIRWVRDTQNPLSPEDTTWMLRIFEAPKKLSPFMRSVEIKSGDEREINKLKPSVLKDFVDSIKSNPEIKQTVVVKGYRGLMHVDIIKGGFHGVASNVYKGQSSSSFFGAQDNIDRPSLAKEREKELKAMEKKPIEIAKSIKVIISPNRK